MNLDTVRQWLDESDRVLIGAGAGLSVAAGYDYGDPVRFAELFPALHRLGLRARYQLIGARLPPDLLWGYWAAHVTDIRFGPGPHPVYERLRALIGERDHFVMTSNVDGLFARGGFDPGRVFTVQGDYGRYQCETPCTRQTWQSRPIIDAALAAYDPSTGRVTDPAAIPSCPNCGGEVFLNVHKGPEYIVDPYLPAGRRLQSWLAAAPADERLLVLDLGSGYNTPGVIRWPMERVARERPRGRLIRVNTQHPEVPAELGGRAFGTSVDAGVLLAELTAPRLP
ncbi:NAD-dependent protein deacetylase of SIR2 family [Actinoplanes sp. NPDC051494]|uniref:NAD-dependent protein deacetylase of SIR2 family n=1 Tax=Actinoplanes sp. NPDC051494 TaxID=3363907 RepID=UPI0037AED38C